MEMDNKWVEKKKDEVKNLWKKIEVEIIIDRENEPKMEELSEILGVEKSEERKIDFNKYLIVEEREGNNLQRYYKQKHYNKEVSGENRKKIAIADILGEYSYDEKNRKHKITLFEKNINKCVEALKNRLLAVLRYLAIGIPPRYSDRNHFPMEFSWVREVLKSSGNYEEFVYKISKFLIEEWEFWETIPKLITEEERKKGEIDLSEKIELLNICEREIFDCLYEIVFFHELGHMSHNISLNEYKKFTELQGNIKEVFADLFALFSASTLKEKIIFYSLAQISNESWFDYYKKFYEKKDFVEKIKKQDTLINFLKEEVK
jgi:hypothetical protein